MDQTEMTICPSCGASVSKGANFCNVCGGKMPLLCKNCGSPIPEGCLFCQQCGSPVAPEKSDTSAADKYSSQEPQQNEPSPVQVLQKINEQQLSTVPYAYTPTPVPTSIAKTPGKSPLKVIIPVVVAAALIVCAVTAVYFSHPKSALSITYLKDNEIYHTDLSKIEPKQITSDLFKNSGNSDSSTNSSSSIYPVRESKDGHYLYYPDNLDTSDDGCSLYFRNLTDKKVKDGTKIDTDVKSNFQINEAGTLAFYVNTDGGLYYFNLKDKNKIDSDVKDFYISPDGGRIIYIKEDGTLYQQDIVGKKDKEKVSDDAEILGMAKDLSTYYYSGNDSLYRKTFDKSEDKVTSDFNQLVVSFEDGSAYYTTGSDNTASLYDYVEDDTASSDASITEPQISDYETQTSTTDFWGFLYNTPQFDEAGYDKAYQAYTDKETRDTLRSELKSKTVNIPDSTLYYYDGTSETSVTDHYNEQIAKSDGAPALLYTVNSNPDVGKTKLSDITSADDFETKIEDALKAAAKTHISAKTNDIELDTDKADYFQFNSSGTAYYYLNEYSSDKESGTLMEGKIESSKPDSPSSVDEDISGYGFAKKSDTLIYLKDYKDNAGDLYVNKKKVDSDVSSNLIALDNSSTVAYLSDYSDKENSGTLKSYNGKESIRISDDVESFLILDTSHLVFISNYDTNAKTGDLFYYDGSKKVKSIDKDVANIINTQS